MQKMTPDCTQERVFCERTPSKKSKISACGGPKTSFLNVSDHLKYQNFRFRNSKNLLKNKKINFSKTFKNEVL